jgi:hypothetical protein
MHHDLIVVSESVLTRDCSWNTNFQNNLYGYSFTDKDVICGGFFGGTTAKFVELCDKLLQESVNIPMQLHLAHGADQPMLNKLIHHGEVDIAIYKEEELLVAHLHQYFQDKNKKININGITVVDLHNRPFAIVHQYNRDIKLYNDVLNYFQSFFAIDQSR